MKNLKAIGVVCCACLLASCDAVDSMKEGFAHSQAVSSQLEKSLGVKSFVGFNWNNGALTSVNVTFQGIPQNVTLPDIVEKSKRAVAAEFKQTPRQIVVGFSVEP
jgi:major membrane immunogen (membrane-anchored lipoprotein)